MADLNVHFAPSEHDALSIHLQDGLEAMETEHAPDSVYGQHALSGTSGLLPDCASGQQQLYLCLEEHLFGSNIFTSSKADTDAPSNDRHHQHGDQRSAAKMARASELVYDSDGQSSRLSSTLLSDDHASNKVARSIKKTSNKRHSRGKESEEGETLYCFCRRPDDFKLMIQCNDCEEWFHAACLKLSEKQVQKMSQYCCSLCTQKKKHIKSYRTSDSDEHSGTFPVTIKLEQVLPRLIEKDASGFTKQHKEPQGAVFEKKTSKSAQLKADSSKKSKTEGKKDPEPGAITDTNNNGPQNTKTEHFLKMVAPQNEKVRNSAKEGLYNTLIKFKGEYENAKISVHAFMDASMSDLCERIEHEMFQAYKEEPVHTAAITKHYALSSTAASLNASLSLPKADRPGQTNSANKANSGYVGIKYKNKYRSLVFNLKDERNGQLRWDVLNKRITPFELVRMSSEALAPKCLKDQIEKSHQKRQTEDATEDILVDSYGGFIRKTHRGDEVIQTDDQLNLALLNAYESAAMNKTIPTTLNVSEDKTKHENAVLPELESNSVAETEIDKENGSSIKETDQGSLANDESKLYASLFETSSKFVASKRASLLKDTSAKAASPPPRPIWNGWLCLPSVTRVVASAVPHSIVHHKTTHHRPTVKLEDIKLPPILNIHGRIEAGKALEYLQGVFKSTSKCIGVLQVLGKSHQFQERFPLSPDEAENLPESLELDSLHDHFLSRKRYGVIFSNNNKSFGANDTQYAYKSTHDHPSLGEWVCRDLYLVPVCQGEALPSPLDQVDVDLLAHAAMAEGHYRLKHDNKTVLLVAVLAKTTTPLLDSYPVQPKESFKYKSIDEGRLDSSSIPFSSKAKVAANVALKQAKGSPLSKSTRAVASASDDAFMNNNDSTVNDAKPAPALEIHDADVDVDAHLAVLTPDLANALESLSAAMQTSDFDISSLLGGLSTANHHQ